jgi:hypothetical protein
VQLAHVDVIVCSSTEFPGDEGSFCAVSSLVHIDG